MQNFTDVHLGSSIKDALIFMNVPLSVGHGSRNKTLHTGWLNQQEFVLPAVPEAGRLRTRVSRIAVLRPLLGVQIAVSWCLSSVCAHVGVPVPSAYKAAVLGLGPTL